MGVWRVSRATSCCRIEAAYVLQRRHRETRQKREEAYRLVEGVLAWEVSQLVLRFVVNEADGARLVFHVFHFPVLDCRTGRIVCVGKTATTCHIDKANDGVKGGT